MGRRDERGMANGPRVGARLNLYAGRVLAQGL